MVDHTMASRSPVDVAWRRPCAARVLCSAQNKMDAAFVESIFSSKDEPEDGGWGFLRSWGSFLVFWF